MAEERRASGRDVLAVGVLAVVVVLGAAILTSVLPVEAQRLIFHSPLLIVVLLVGTAGLLWRITTHRPPEA